MYIRTKFDFDRGACTVVALGIGSSRRLALELFSEGHVVEEGPGVVELGVPSALEVLHRLDHVVDLLVAHQREEGGIDAVGLARIGGISLRCSHEDSFWLTGGCAEDLGSAGCRLEEGLHEKGKGGPYDRDLGRAQS